eukprot:5034656-Ditylum_brightwellii.AAC.1
MQPLMLGWALTALRHRVRPWPSCTACTPTCTPPQTSTVYNTTLECSSDEGKSDTEDDVGKRRAKSHKRTAQRNATASKIQTQWKKSVWIVAEY